MIARVVVLVVLAAACGSTATQAPTTLAVTDAGGGPKRVLRYQLLPGASERFELGVKMRVASAFTNTTLEDGRSFADLPTIQLVVRHDVAAVEPGGDAQIAAEVEGVTVLDDVLEPAQRTLAERQATALRGARASWRISPTGWISDVHVRDTYLETMRDHALAFPDEPVAVGASWRVTSEPTLSGVKWTRTVTYRLTALTETSATIETDTVMRAGSQSLSVEPRATTVLTSGSAHSTGELVVRRDGILATGTARGTMEVNLQIVRDRLRIASTLRTEMLSTVKRR